MLYHAESFFQIAFGDVRSQFHPKKFIHEASTKLLSREPFLQIKKFMKINELIFLHQVHGNYGLTINDRKQLVQFKSFEHDGDFILTNLSSVGIAIATADCLPIILYNSFCPAVGIIHAGWRGSVAQVAVAALEHMIRSFNIDISTMRVFFGPSAQRCCYSVGQEVIDKLKAFSFKDDVIREVDGTLFFDLPLFNMLQLQEAGVPPSAFNGAYNVCTICTPSFCSYRRQQGNQRNMTVVALR